MAVRSAAVSAHERVSPALDLLAALGGKKNPKKNESRNTLKQLYFSCTPTALRRNHDHFNGATSHMVSMPRL